MDKTEEVGIYIGRFSPLHKGHQRVIDKMIEKYGPENILIVVGSINRSDYKNIFPYDKRIGFIRKVYPELKVVGYPDFDCDKRWFSNLLDTINVFFEGRKPIFYAGARADIYWMEDQSVVIYDRNVHDISATKVRNALWENTDVSYMIDEKILDEVKEVFKDRITHYTTDTGWSDYHVGRIET